MGTYLKTEVLGCALIPNGCVFGQGAYQKNEKQTYHATIFFFI